MMRRTGNIPIRAMLAPLAAALWILGGAGFLEFVFDEAYKGNREFEHGRYDQAQQHYTEAQVKNPGAPSLDFNLGGALYKQGKFDDSLTAYRKSYYSDDPNVVADAHYNAGNALFKKGAYPEAIQEYIEALKRRPGDEDAKYNLELARRLLAQQDPENRNKNPDQKKDDPKDDQGGGGDQEGDKPDEGEKGDQQGENEGGEKGKSESKDEKTDAAKPTPEPADRQDEDKPRDEEERRSDEAHAEESTEQQTVDNLTPDQAARILDSLKRDEQAELIRQILPKTGYTVPDKDW